MSLLITSLLQAVAQYFDAVGWMTGKASGLWKPALRILKDLPLVDMA